VTRNKYAISLSLICAVIAHEIRNLRDEIRRLHAMEAMAADNDEPRPRWLN
jgi:hypothetical protein